MSAFKKKSIKRKNRSKKESTERKETEVIRLCKLFKEQLLYANLETLDC